MLSLAPLVLLAVLIRPPRTELDPDSPDVVHADEKLTTADIAEFAERKLKKRRDADPTTNALLAYAPPNDAYRVRDCGRAVLRFTSESTGLDLLVVRRCDNYYCPWCPRESHIRRTLYQAAKFQSLSAKNELSVINIVWSLPPTLQSFVRHHDAAFTSWRTAIRKTIASAYRYKGAHGVHVEEACWRELGAIINYHAIGDKAKPWPKAQPHADMLLAAHRRRGDALEPMPEKWPELYDHTSRAYRKHLRAELSALATRLGEHDVARFLRTEFDVDWHVSPNGEGGIVQRDRAMHRIRYSCRPLFDLARCRLERDEDDPPVLAIRSHVDDGKVQYTHRVPPGPAFGQLESLRAMMHGRKARTHMGILGKRAYGDAVAPAGHDPVVERPKRGLRVKQAWRQQKDDTFRPVDPREVL